MRVLIIHNRYREFGGEDAAVRAEAAMLEAAGHEVVRYFRSSDEVRLETLAQKAAVTAGMVWSFEAYRAIRAIVRCERPDVAHCHNLFPLISPSAYKACRDEGIPVVQTLHNFRMFCTGATLFRKGQPCEECLRVKSLLPGVIHGCYGENRVTSALVAWATAVHRNLEASQANVDVYIALSEFARRKFEEGGVAASRIAVKGNPTSVNGPGPVGGDYALFVGRLAKEKGVATMLNAWKAADIRRPLRVVGDGPLRLELELEKERLGVNDVEFEGRLNHELTLDRIRNSRFLIFPSECYENCPMTIIEAFAAGVPVIAARRGAAEEMVEDGQTGRLFEAGNAQNLAEVLKWVWRNPEAMESMGRRARVAFDRKYEPTRNVEALEAIYKRAIAERKLASLN